MYNLHLTPEQLEFRDTVRGFVDDEVKPVTLNAQPSRCRRPQPADGRAAQGLADGAAYAGAARGPGRRRRRGADLHASSPRSLRPATADVAAVLTETSALVAAPVRRDDGRAARALWRGVPRGRRLSSGAGLPRARRRQRARHQLPPAGHRDAARHHRHPRRRPLAHQRRQGLRRQRADRQADRGRGADRQGRRRCSWCRARRQASPSPTSPSRAGITAPAGSLR